MNINTDEYLSTNKINISLDDEMLEEINGYKIQIDQMKNFIIKKDEETNDLLNQLDECRAELMRYKLNKEVKYNIKAIKTGLF